MEIAKVMGIVNVTPDSFSDGGRYFESAEAVRRAANMLEEGADVIDIGGESTRPGADKLDWSEEWRRIAPVVRELAPRAVVSVDTYHPETAERALDEGIKIVNCVYLSPIGEMFALLRRYPQAELAMPYRIGGFADNGGRNAPIPPELAGRVYLDPMVGFGTTRDEDLALLKSIGEMSSLGRVLVGASRKRIVKKLTGEKFTGKNVGGNLAIALYAAASGASMIRVHDVRETVQALKTWNALR